MINLDYIFNTYSYCFKHKKEYILNFTKNKNKLTPTLLYPRANPVIIS